LSPVEVASIVVAPAPASTPPSSSSPPVIRWVAAVIVFLPPTPHARGHLEQRKVRTSGTTRKGRERERAASNETKVIFFFRSHILFCLCSSSKAGRRTQTNHSNESNEEAAAAREASRRRLRRSRNADDAFAAVDGALVPGVPLRGWEVRERGREKEREATDDGRRLSASIGFSIRCFLQSLVRSPLSSHSLSLSSDFDHSCAHDNKQAVFHQPGAVLHGT